MPGYRVIEDGFVDDAHLVPVQLPHQLVVHHAGVDASLGTASCMLSRKMNHVTHLDLEAAVEGLAALHGLHGHEEVEVEAGHVAGHHGQRGQRLASAVHGESLLVEEHPGYLVPDQDRLQCSGVTSRAVNRTSFTMPRKSPN